MLRRLIAIVFTLFISLPAFAGKVAVVDFQRAVTETDEGKAAQAKLDTMYATKKDGIEKMKADVLDKEIKDYQSRSLILSDDARNQAEADLGQKQQAFEQTYQQYQQDMQSTYYTLLSDLDQKMRALTEKIAKEKGYDVVLDRAAVVYSGGDTVDMTDDLIARYNAQTKAGGGARPATPTPAPSPAPKPPTH